MNVLLTGMDWFPNARGGLNRYFYDEVHALPSAGVRGTALVSYLKEGQSAPLELRAMARPGASILRRWGGARRIVGEMLRGGVDLVNSHFALYAYPWVRDLPGGTPLVVNFQGPWADEIAVESPGGRGRLRVAFARHIERRVYNRADRVITLSEAFCDIVHRRYAVPRERIRVVPAGLNTSRFLDAPERRAARECLGWPADRRIVLTVRRLARRMGLEGLIEAMEEVRRADPGVLLLIGGKGALAAELEARIRERGLAGNVRLLGFLSDDDLPLAYAAADLSVVPTVALEGFGLVTVESLASGTPVLGTPVDATPEILGGLEPRLLFESPAPAAMADRLIEALAGRIPLPGPAECRAYAARYDWARIIPRIRAVFDEASAARARPAAPDCGVEARRRP